LILSATGQFFVDYYCIHSVYVSFVVFAVCCHLHRMPIWANLPGTYSARASVRHLF